MDISNGKNLQFPANGGFICRAGDKMDRVREVASVWRAYYNANARAPGFGVGGDNCCSFGRQLAICESCSRHDKCVCKFCGGGGVSFALLGNGVSRGDSVLDATNGGCRQGNLGAGDGLKSPSCQLLRDVPGNDDGVVLGVGSAQTLKEKPSVVVGDSGVSDCLRGVDSADSSEKGKKEGRSDSLESEGSVVGSGVSESGLSKSRKKKKTKFVGTMVINEPDRAL